MVVQRVLCIPFRNRSKELSWFPLALPTGPSTPPSSAEYANARGVEKLVLAGPYYSHVAQVAWRQWEHEAANTFKHRVWALSKRALERLSVSETFFKGVDLFAERVELHHAASELDQAAVVAKLSGVLKVAPARHFRLMLASGLTVPFAAVLLTALPGPNVVLYWAAFRTYSHFTAWQGARHVAQLVRNNHVSFVDAPPLAATLLGDPPSAAQISAAFPDAPPADLALAIAQAVRR